VFIRFWESIIRILLGFGFWGYIYMFIVSRKEGCLLLILINENTQSRVYSSFSIKMLKSI
jgi:hypothetical protein